MIVSCSDAKTANATVTKLMDMLHERPPVNEVLSVLFNEVGLIEALPAIAASKHPQGFLTFKLGISADKMQSLRFHVWLPYKREVVDSFDIHNHVFGFTSLLLAGAMENIRYRAEETHIETGHRFFDVSYNSANEDVLTAAENPVDVYTIGKDQLRARDYYNIAAGDYHRNVVPARVLTMTLLSARADPAVKFPRMVGPVSFGGPFVTTRARPSAEDVDFVVTQLKSLRDRANGSRSQFFPA